MKALVHVFGVLLAAAAVYLLLISLIAFNRQSDSTWWIGGETLSLGIAALVISILILRKTMATALGRCPKCGHSGYRVPALSIARSRGMVLDLFGKHFIGSLWGASQEQKVVCLECETSYFTHTQASRIAGVLVWISLFFILFAQLGNSLLGSR